LWSLANLITGFFVAQYLAVAIALGDKLDDLAKKGPAFKVTVSIIAVVVAGFYCLALRACRKFARQLDSDSKHDFIWFHVNKWRIGCIALFTAIFIFALFEHDIQLLH
jgi:hypothetical protein